MHSASHHFTTMPYTCSECGGNPAHEWHMFTLNQASLKVPVICLMVCPVCERSSVWVNGTSVWAEPLASEEPVAAPAPGRLHILAGKIAASLRVLPALLNRTREPHLRT